MGFDDSKALSPAQREGLFERIDKVRLLISVVVVVIVAAIAPAGVLFLFLGWCSLRQLHASTNVLCLFMLPLIPRR